MGVRKCAQACKSCGTEVAFYTAFTHTILPYHVYVNQLMASLREADTQGCALDNQRACRESNIVIPRGSASRRVRVPTFGHRTSLLILFETRTETRPATYIAEGQQRE
jgi:hypothetical protein